MKIIFYINLIIIIFSFRLNILSAPNKTKASKKSYKIAALPLANYNSDRGFGFGAGLVYFDYNKNYKPFRNSVFAQFFMTTRKIHRHFVQWQAPNFLHSHLYLKLRAAMIRQLYSNYFGIGNTVSKTNNQNSGDKIKHYFKFTNTTPQIDIQFTKIVHKPFAIRFGYTFQYWKIDIYHNSLLEEENPFGANGGIISMIHAAISFDTRDQAVATNKGHWIELSARLNLKILGGKSNFIGFSFVTRNYFTIVKDLVFANRIMADMLIGNIPFFYLPSFGDTEFTYGLGGAWSLRGLCENRYIGKIKLLDNAELRYLFLRWSWWNSSFALQGVALFDAGRVWKDFASDGNLFNIHFGGGGGIRLIWEKFIFRAEFAFSSEDKGIYVQALTFF